MSYSIRIRMSETNAPDNALERIEEVKSTFRTVLGGDTSDATVKDFIKYAERRDDQRLVNSIKSYLSGKGSEDDTADSLETWVDDRYVKKIIKDWKPDFETLWEFREAIDDPDFSRPAHHYSLLYFDTEEYMNDVLDDLNSNQFPSVDWYLVESREVDSELNYGVYRDDPEYSLIDTGPTLNPRVDIIDWELKVSFVSYKINGELYRFTNRRFNIDKPEDGDRTDLIVGTEGSVEYLKDTEETPEDNVLLSTLDVHTIEFKGEEVPRVSHTEPTQSGQNTGWVEEKSRGSIPEGIQ